MNPPQWWRSRAAQAASRIARAKQPGLGEALFEQAVRDLADRASADPDPQWAAFGVRFGELIEAGMAASLAADLAEESAA